MPSIKDKSTVEAIAREFCSNGRNKEQALAALDYKPSYYKSGRAVQVVYGSARVKAAIARIDAEKQIKYEHNQEIAVKLLNTDRDYLEVQAKLGNIAAIQARTAIIRELDNITGLQGQTITTKQDGAVVLTEGEQRALDDIRKQFRLKLSETG